MVDLAVSVAQISPLPGPYPFEPSTYRIKVTNNGAINATAVNVTHTIPASLTGVSSNTSQGTYNGSTWNIGSLASGASATLTVTGAPNLPSPSTFSPSAQASSSETDSNPGNNTGSTTIPVRIIVNTLSDSGTGGCNTTECTLREAIALAALTTGMDTITFSSSGTISLNGTQLLVDSDIDLRASGITIDAANLSRIMQVNNPGGIVKVNGITMTRGNCNSAGCWSGGILNSSSTMTITNSTFTNSTAEWGAAVFNADIMTIDSSNFANNVSWSAGAVTNSGTLTVSNSNFTSNVALALGNGGGIDNWATATVNTSTFNSNVPDHCVGITMTGTGNTLINPAIDPDCP